MSKSYCPYEGCVAAWLIASVTGCVSVESASAPDDVFEPDAATSQDLEADFAAELGIEIPAEDVAETARAEVEAKTTANPGVEAEGADEYPEFREMDDPLGAAFEDDSDTGGGEESAASGAGEAPPTLAPEEEAALQRIRVDGAADEDSDWYEVDPSSLVGEELDGEDTSAGGRRFGTRSVEDLSKDEQLAVLGELINAPLGNVADQLGAHAMLADADVELDIDASSEHEAVDAFESDGAAALELVASAPEAAPETTPTFQLRGRVVTSPGAVGRFAIGPRTVVVRSYS
jgi:hypothetical protein